MAPKDQFRTRRRAITRRRFWLRRGTAIWIALLLGGMVMVTVAATHLISASAARTQAMVAQQKYLGSTSASLRSSPAPLPPRSLPTSSAAQTRQTAVQHSLVSSTSSISRSSPRPSSRPLPSPPPPSIPMSIELAGSLNAIRVIPIGVSAAGVLEPPSDISTAGWWVSGPRPGAPGRAVITGHIDSTAGLGAFAALDLLRSGDAISLHEADGRILQFRVTTRQQIEKTQLDPGLLQHTTNSSDLLLVTCIGNFNYSTRSYDSNLLITAVPVSQ